MPEIQGNANQRQANQRSGGSATENPVGSFFFEGSIDEMAVYDKPLSPEIVLTH